jgi:hypothetical protein
LRRFIYNFVELVKFIIAMLRKDSEVKWTADARKYFELMKKYFVDAPVLIIPKFSKVFLIFSFAFDDTLVVVFLQKNKDGLEKPISLFSISLRDVEIKYDIMEKHAYALVKALMMYVLHSKIITYVSSSAVREILIQPDIDGKRSKWIVEILEFDSKINPTNMLKGKGLARLLANSNCKDLGVNFMENF